MAVASGKRDSIFVSKYEGEWTVESEIGLEDRNIDIDKASDPERPGS
jgi:hypothetical protein